MGYVEISQVYIRCGAVLQLGLIDSCEVCDIGLCRP